MRKGQQTVFHSHVTKNHLRIDIVELISFRKSRLCDARHFGRILTDEVGDIRHIQSLLQHEVAAFQVGNEQIQMGIPSIVTIELIAIPGIQPRTFVFRFLGDIHMEQAVVDTFREEQVAPLFHHLGIPAVGSSTTGERFGRDFPLPVDMGTGRSSAVFHIAQIPFAPELAGHFVRLASVLEELTHKSPMAVVFQPGGQAMLMTQAGQFANVVVGQLFRH